MERVGEHPVPRGPLAVRWLAHDSGPFRAGSLQRLRVGFENAGSAPWREVRLSYHWLDPLGNAVVWDGVRTHLPAAKPGERLEAAAEVRAPIPPGRYRLALDLVLEHRYWFSEVGNVPLELEVEVTPRIERRLAALGAEVRDQEEPLVPLADAEAVAHLAPGCRPAPDWSRRVLDAHQEGYGVVAGSFEAGRNRALSPWLPGTGRNPGFAHPLLCPSVVSGVEPDWLDPVEGLPAAVAPGEEPWVYDGRITVTLRR